ncbi:ribonuclease 3-like [Magnolia sinica]|uniref:ribonuclease 3-like n=1 Tax=Magnolia sinica TaxID=86752 RepID=UPI00265991FD|nr:ribonuclease 3-like [Magnolia sinica]
MAPGIASASFLVSLLFFSSAIATATADFDFFYFILMWPGSFCVRNGCCLPEAFPEPELDFFVKGMYPAKKTGELVSCCNTSTTKFYVNEVADLIGDMNAYWPNIRCPSNNGRSNWENLWGRYGNCSGLTETDYFSRALELRSRVNLLPKLKRADILPNDRDYNLGYVQAAIDDAVGNKKTAVHCSKILGWCYHRGYRYRCTKYLVNEISICTDKNATTIIHCPKYSVSTCGDIVTFPKFTYHMMKKCEPESFNPIQMLTSFSE